MYVKKWAFYTSAQYGPEKISSKYFQAVNYSQGVGCLKEQRDSKQTSQEGPGERRRYETCHEGRMNDIICAISELQASVQNYLPFTCT